MAGPALKLAVSEPPIDINEANATEIREALPGIGEKLAMRIVAYRDQHGPFESANDLTRVQGINEKRVSLMANRISVMPSNSGYRRSAPETLRDESGHPSSRRFSINSDAMPGAFAASLDSLLPNGPEEPNYRGSLMPSARPLHSDIGGSILSAAPPARRATVSPTSLPAEQVVEDTDAYLQIPLSRPWRVWVVLGALGLFSGLGGAIVGVRSQDGGSRSQIERRVGRVQSDVATISGSVHQLETQATTFADSINALDSRISEQEQKTSPRAKVGSYATAKTPEKAPAPLNTPRDADESPTRLRVREALTQFESALPPRAAK
ncbi:MAG TPA: helix-hairpin-helix domain-containing protein [Polyangiaceae bacterium]|nr:helix-hairpin-helix domain-containing protein [Polyangiaceae bacterium]